VVFFDSFLDFLHFINLLWCFCQFEPIGCWTSFAGLESLIDAFHHGFSGRLDFVSISVPEIDCSSNSIDFGRDLKKITQCITLYGSSSWAPEECLWLNCYWVSVLTAYSGSTPFSTKESYLLLYYLALSARIFILVCFSSRCPMPNIFKNCLRKKILYWDKLCLSFIFIFPLIHLFFI
jgi:hypothetical protein